MLTFLFFLFMLIIFGKILKFAIKATWGISKILFSLVFLPLILIGLVLKGLLMLALPILVVIGIIAVIVLRD